MWKLELAALSPPPLCDWILNIPDDTAEVATELRLRSGRPPTIRTAGKEMQIAEETVDGGLLIRLLSAFSGRSPYSKQDQISSGFITLKGGFRVGLAGGAAYGGGGIQALTSINAMSVRIPREVKGCSQAMVKRLYGSGFKSTLIISPPGLGKTTLLRDAVRLLSDGGSTVALADERGEVAALYNGAAHFDVGARTDVLDGCPKHSAIPILVRSMSPDIVACDEIGREQDAEALAEAVLCGVKIIATAHCAGYAELQRREGLKRLTQAAAFERIAELGGFPGNIAQLCDEKGRAL